MTKHAKTKDVKVVTFSFEAHSGCPIVPDDVFPGYSENGDGAFSAPLLEPPNVQTQVSSAQAKIALQRASHVDAVKAAVATNAELQIWFHDAPNWRRYNVDITTVGAGLGFTVDDIDALLITADQIDA